mgnify:FL=1
MDTGVNSSEQARVQYLHELGERLHEERLANGYLAQGALAKALGGMNPETVGRWERGKSEPGAFALSLIGQLGLDVDYILTGRLGMLKGKLASPEVETLRERGVHLGPAGAEREVHFTLGGFMWLLKVQKRFGDGQPLQWGVQLLRSIARAEHSGVQKMYVQAVALQSDDFVDQWCLVFGLGGIPPCPRWWLPSPGGLQARYDLSADSGSLPLECPANGYLTPVLLLGRDELAELNAHGLCTVTGSQDALAMPTHP